MFSGNDFRKRASASDEPSRPVKRRSREPVAEVRPITRGSSSLSILTGSTLVDTQDMSWAEPPASSSSGKENMGPADNLPHRSRLASMDTDKESGLHAKLTAFGRRASDAFSKNARRVKDLTSASRPVRDDAEQDRNEAIIKGEPLRKRAKSFTLSTKARQVEQAVEPYVDRSALFYRNPPMRTSSLEHDSSRDASPAVNARAPCATIAFTRNRRRSIRRDSPRPTYLQHESDRESGVSLTPDPDVRYAAEQLCKMLVPTSPRPIGIDPAEHLPSETMLHIFSYLDASDLKTASETCKAWKKFADDKHVLMKAFLRKYQTIPAISSLPAPVGGLGVGVKRPDGSSLPVQDWKKMYTARNQLQRNWNAGVVETKYLFGHTDSVYCVQFDEHKAITGSRDRTIRIWDLKTMKCTKVIGGPNARELDRRSIGNPAPEFTEHMQRYLQKAGACTWHTYPTPADYHVPNYYHCASILCLQYDDEIMVTGSSDATLIVWDMKTLQPIRQLRHHRSGVLDLAFDDDKIVSCSKDFTICVWDRKTGDFLHQIEGHKGPVNAVQLRGSLVVSASGEGSSHMYDLNFVRRPSPIPGMPDEITMDPKLLKEFWSEARGLACIEFSDDAKHIIAGGNDHMIFKYDTETAVKIDSMSGHEGLVRSLYLDGANNRIVSGSYDMSIKVWDFKTGALVRTYEARTTSWMLSAKSDYRRIVATSQDGRVAVLDFGHGVPDVELLSGS